MAELSKLTKTCEELLDLKEKWCYFLKESGNLTTMEIPDIKAIIIINAVCRFIVISYVHY